MMVISLKTCRFRRQRIVVVCRRRRPKKKEDQQVLPFFFVLLLLLPMKKLAISDQPVRRETWTLKDDMSIKDSDAIFFYF